MTGTSKTENLLILLAKCCQRKQDHVCMCVLDGRSVCVKCLCILVFPEVSC